MKNTIRYIDDNTAIVTKAFQKKASIYGTDEFKLWREYKAQFPDAVMTTKEIKKNPNKKTSTKNMTYENMALFIKEQDNAVALMAEFKREYNNWNFASSGRGSNQGCGTPRPREPR